MVLSVLYALIQGAAILLIFIAPGKYWFKGVSKSLSTIKRTTLNKSDAFSGGQDGLSGVLAWPDWKPS